MKNLPAPVLINIVTVAHYENGMDFPLQFITRGVLNSPGKGMIQLDYTESLEDEETGRPVESQIRLVIEKGRITMTREGEFSSMMVFSRDRRFEGSYRTPYGEMEMAVYTLSLSADTGEERGSIHARYHLELQGSYASTHEIHLEYTLE